MHSAFRILIATHGVQTVVYGKVSNVIVANDGLSGSTLVSRNFVINRGQIVIQVNEFIQRENVCQQVSCDGVSCVLSVK